MYTENDVEKTISNITSHTVTYNYNLANRLLSETESVTGTVDGESKTVSYTKQYTYDANGNTLKKEVTGQINSSVVEYTYNPLNQLTALNCLGTCLILHGFENK